MIKLNFTALTPIHISNVMLWDGKQATKVKRTRETGKLVRVSKKSGQPVK